MHLCLLVALSQILVLSNILNSETAGVPIHDIQLNMWSDVNLGT